MKFFGDIDMQENELQNLSFSSEETVPSSTKQGRILYKNNRLFIVSEISGTPIWVPLTKEFDTYIHAQTTAATTWTVTHNLNNTSLNVVVYDSNDEVIIPDSVSIVDANTVTITLTSNSIGKVTVFGGYTGTTEALNNLLGVTPALGVIFLMNTDDVQGSTTFTDDTGRNTITASGDVEHWAGISKFGNSSARFAAVPGNALNVSASSDFNYGTSDFTIEMWIWVHSSTASNREIWVNNGADGRQANNPSLLHDVNKLSFNVGTFTISSTTAINTETWRHVAVVRSSGVVTLYIDGVAEGGTQPYTTDISSSANGTPAPRMGGPSYIGYIDSVRIDNGNAVYTENFTPPTTPFTV